MGVFCKVSLEYRVSQCIASYITADQLWQHRCFRISKAVATVINGHGISISWYRLLKVKMTNLISRRHFFLQNNIFYNMKIPLLFYFKLTKFHFKERTKILFFFLFLDPSLLFFRFFFSCFYFFRHLYIFTPRKFSVSNNDDRDRTLGSSVM